MVGVKLGVESGVGVDVSAGGVGVTINAITSLKEQALKAKAIIRL